MAQETFGNNKTLQKHILVFLCMNQMLISCSFNGIECGETNFTWFWSNDYGNCYTFIGNMNGYSIRTSQAGYDKGLQLELLVGKSSQLKY